jgi:hypothetical protein
MAQQPTEQLDAFVERRLQIQRTGMAVLGSWAAANIAAGTTLSVFDEERRDFHQMNALWNTVNLGLATAGYLGARNPPASPTLAEAIERQHSIEKILLFNAGLDVGYMVGGFYMRELARRDGADPRLDGWGSSLILQGGFLLAFDVILYLVNRTNRGYRSLLDGS